jgi:hypothetical protein
MWVTRVSKFMRKCMQVSGLNAAFIPRMGLTSVPLPVTQYLYALRPPLPCSG